MDILSGLNEKQIEAVTATDGPLLVIAGAGSGKTKVITHRVAYLISKGIVPEKILAITFTNKAAEEMRQRILNLLNFKNHQSLTINHQLPFISTFHSLGVYILRQDGEKIGVSKRFSILDEDDSLKIIKEILKELDLSDETFKPNRLRGFISVQKNKLVNYEDFLTEQVDYYPKIMADVWYRYEEKLKQISSLDFDDLIVKTIILFQKEPEVLKKYQERWQYAHIDEYQDTNYPQYLLSKLLTMSHNNLCAVGDHDQAIYSFRGADFTNILNFNKDYEGAKIVSLEKNYRSTQNILNAANAAISFNKARYPKNLYTEKNEGALPLLFSAEDEISEGEFVAKIAKSILEQENSKIAVLLRTNFQSRIFEEFFLRHDLPYKVIGIKFFGRKEVKDILAYLKFAFNRQDFLSLKRIVSAAPRGIGEKTLLKFFNKEQGIQLSKIKEIEKIIVLSDKILELSEKIPVSEILKIVFQESGLEEYLENSGSEGEQRIENIKELVSVAKKYDSFLPQESVFKLLEESALISDQDNIQNEDKAIKIITVHAAKGLEFDTVFVVGLEDGLFPYRSSNDIDKEMKLEEERRLFYVALTRAKKNLYLSYAKTRMIFGDRKINRPSKFLMEIKDKIVTL